MHRRHPPHQHMPPRHKWVMTPPLMEQLSFHRFSLTDNLLSQRVPSKAQNPNRPKRQPRKPSRLGSRSSLVSTGVLPVYRRQVLVSSQRPAPSSMTEPLMEMKTIRHVKILSIPVDEAMPRLTLRQLLRVAIQPPLLRSHSLNYPQPNYLSSGWHRWLSYAKQSRVLRRSFTTRSKHMSRES